MSIKKFQWSVFNTGFAQKAAELVNGIKRAALGLDRSVHDVFISWAHVDAPIVKDQLLPALKEDEFDVWIDLQQ